MALGEGQNLVNNPTNPRFDRPIAFFFAKTLGILISRTTFSSQIKLLQVVYFYLFVLLSIDKKTFPKRTFRFSYEASNKSMATRTTQTFGLKASKIQNPESKGN